MKIIVFVLLQFLFLTAVSFSNNAVEKDNGIINGKVIDNETQNGVENAVIKIQNSELRTVSGKNGEFSFSNLKCGTYNLSVNVVGYAPLLKGDIVIISDKAVDVIIGLNPSGLSTETIDIESNYFQKNSDVNLSIMNLDYEEIRRAPGAVEDISRMLQTAPGVSIVNDQRNDLVVRGGSPSENLIMIDGVEIPNINHYGSQGTTGGPIGYINLKFIREADILTGGFNSRFGDRLSSVVDIKFREGSQSNYINNIDLSFAGFGGIFEGPISKKSNYLLSVRRSYLDLLKGSIRLAAVPNYWDINMKLNYKFDDNNTIGLIGFGAIDKINFKIDESSTVDDFPYNSDNKTNSYTGGVTYNHLMNRGYIRAVLSNTYTDFFSDNIYYPTGKQEYYINSYENEATSKLELNYRLTSSVDVSSGIGYKNAAFKNNLFASADTTPAGYFIPEQRAENKLNANKFYGYVNFTNKMFGEKLTLNAGLRYDYFDFINLKSAVSPRAGLSYSVLPSTIVNASYGIFYQSPQYVWLASDPINKNLSNIRCDHYIFGIEQIFSAGLKAVVEVYQKNYNNYPVSINNPRYILIDGGADYGPNLVGAASSTGHGIVKGIDVSLQKKLTGNGLYGMINYSYSQSGFYATVGGEKPAAFDPEYQFTVIAGYQVADDWLIGLKFKYAGGKPYTPYNVQQSTALGRGVWEMDKFNSEKFPDYHRLDLRIDKKFYFRKSAITTYFELQNVYNRQNVSGYFWNKAKNEQGTIYQWAFMPVGGVSVQF